MQHVYSTSTYLHARTFDAVDVRGGGDLHVLTLGFRPHGDTDSRTDITFHLTDVDALTWLRDAITDHLTALNSGEVAA